MPWELLRIGSLVGARIRVMITIVYIQEPPQRLAKQTIGRAQALGSRADASCEGGRVVLVPVFISREVTGAAQEVKSCQRSTHAVTRVHTCFVRWRM